MSIYRIVTIVLVKNEDIFLKQVLNNIVGFSDKVVIADNLSSDKTSEIAVEFCRQSNKFEYHRIKHPRLSHDLVKGYAGERVWIFGVDGDEIYDPNGLKTLRQKLTCGMYSEEWMLLGNVLHCVSLDCEKNIAKGYLAPPSRSMTKLYNFSTIESWGGNNPERLHGGEIIFRSGYGAAARKYLHDQYRWDDSFFRCLHACFLRRSSLERRRKDILMRPNIADGMRKTLPVRIAERALKVMGIEPKSSFKMEKYMQGPLLEVSTEDFF